MSNLSNIARQVEKWLDDLDYAEFMADVCPFSPIYFGRGCWHDNQGFLRWHYSEINYLACCLAIGLSPKYDDLTSSKDCPCTILGTEKTTRRAREFVAKHGGAK